MLAGPTVVSISQYMSINKTIMLYALNSDIYQLFLNNTGKT